MIDWKDCIVPDTRSYVDYGIHTKCEYCANACGGCSWSEYGVQNPVEGWDAVRRDVPIRQQIDKKYTRQYMESYVVIGCPKFSLEERSRREHDSVDWRKMRWRALQKKGEAICGS